MQKIAKILTEWIPGDLHSLQWFRRRGIEQRLAYKYYSGGTLKKVGPGIYARSKEPLDWVGGVRLLQEELGKKLHVAQKNALELSGHGHYGVMGKKPIVHLRTYDNSRPPSWFKKVDFGIEFVMKNSSLFKTETELIEFVGKSGLKIKIASRELAILEMIDSLDFSHSFETVENYFTSMSTLRPKVVQKLLEKCKSIRTKRIFLYLTERFEHPYFKKLKINKIDLGSGKRVIVKNGELNKKYNITVPKIYGVSPF